MISKIVAKNFQSWKTLEYTPSQGITIIDGWNEDDQTAEGSGKSAVLNALCWALYGKLPKEVNIDDVIKIGEKGCSVEIFFEHNIVQSLVRTRKPNDLLLVDVNYKEIRGKDARETQKIIEEFVGLSFDAFCQSVYFAQNYPKKFISANQEDKGKILSEIQDLKPFDKARKETMELAKKEEANLVSLQNSVEVLNQKLETINTSIFYEKRAVEEALKNYALREEQIKTKIAQGKDQLEAHNKYIQSLIEKKDEMKKVDYSTQGLESDLAELVKARNALYDVEYDTACTEIQQAKADIQARISSIDALYSQRKSDEQALNHHLATAKRTASVINKLKDIIENPQEKCPTCGSVTGHVDTTDMKADMNRSIAELEELDGMITQLQSKVGQKLPRKQELEEEIKQLDQALAKVKQDVVTKANELDKGATQINSQIQRNLENQQHLQELEGKVESELTRLEDKANDIKILNTELGDLEKQAPDTSDSTRKIKELENSQTQLQNELVVRQDLVVKSELHLSRLKRLKSGFKEIKSYVFNSMLQEINVRANQYLERLFEIPARISMANENMKIKTKIELNGNEMSLGLLSGGQNRRFSLAVDLALSDVVLARKGSQLGLLILDEYFKDLSEESMENCLEILQKRKGSTILIEHNSIFKSIVDNSFYVRLVEGTSRVEV